MAGLSGLDAWLEAPYVNAAREEADYERYCEAHDLDPSEDHWDAFEAARYDEQEDAMISTAERRAEDREGEEW